ncbi:MAG: Biotin synthase [Bryobacterales bacterium]|nr:Biotin synthase [Bryobacterales bacterium]
MDTRTKLTILADAAKYDASCASSGSRRERVSGGVGNTTGVGICHSYTPDGRCVSLLKLLLTNYCIYDCTYCINRISSDTPRARFTPEEVVSLTLEFYKRNYIEGLFLSSGVIQSPDYTMEQVIAVAKSLRTDHLFGGYIHLKIPPGASALLIAEAGKWADRLSANIEMPRQADLDRFAPAKTHIEIQQTMGEISQRIIAAKEEKTVYAAAGQSTQMIVGATEASDTDILQKSSALYQDFGMRRVYYSAFSPIPHSDSRLPPQAAPLVREHRLYQADWLLRYYGFDVAELTTAEQPDLPLDKDPKLAWALRNRHFFPVDVNTADREALLRIPGLGVRSVDRIVAMRSQHRFRMEDLTRLTRAFKRMRYFVITSDFNPDSLKLDAPRLPVPQQLSLFSAVTGEF